MLGKQNCVDRAVKHLKGPTNYTLLNPYKPSVLCNSAGPDQTLHNAVSDQELHCLLTESSIKIWKKKIKKYHPTPPKIGNGLLQLIVMRNAIST